MNSPKEKSVELEANAAALETEVEKPFPFPEVMYAPLCERRSQPMPFWRPKSND